MFLELDCKIKEKNEKKEKKLGKYSFLEVSCKSFFNFFEQTHCQILLFNLTLIVK